MKKNIFALFPSTIAADNALRDLEEEGYEAEDVSVIGQEGILKAHDVSETAEDAGKGAGIGGLIGLIAGVAAITIPGVGPVIGTGAIISSILGGAGLGAVTGGLIGALRELFSNTADLAERYEEAIRQGQILIAVDVAAADAHGVQEILARNGGQHITTQNIKIKEKVR